MCAIFFLFSVQPHRPSLTAIMSFVNNVLPIDHKTMARAGTAREEKKNGEKYTTF